MDSLLAENTEVSEELWIYFAVTIPLTLLIVGMWWYIDRLHEKRYAREDEDIEKGIQTMETEILAIMRKKTMSKAATWGSGSKSPTLTKPQHLPFHSLEKQS